MKASVARQCHAINVPGMQMLLEKIICYEQHNYGHDCNVFQCLIHSLIEIYIAEVCLSVSDLLTF
jgi:hypothetical protein